MKPGSHLVLLLLVFGLIACGRDNGNGGDPVFFDDTFDMPGDWRISSDPEVEIAYSDGGLSVQVRVIDRVAWSVAGRRFRDGVVSVDATPVGGPEDNAYGLILWHVDDHRFYRFEISSDGFFAVQAPDSTLGWEFLVNWEEAEAIRRGRETNRLKVEAQGSTMVFYVNDVELARVEDDRYGEGDVGVIAGTFYSDPGTHILFDNFMLEPARES